MHTTNQERYSRRVTNIAPTHFSRTGVPQKWDARRVHSGEAVRDEITTATHIV